MYEGDAPLAERRVAALALDRDLLRDLLGAEELRELLDPAVIAALELELQRLAPERQRPPRRRPPRPPRRPRSARRRRDPRPLHRRPGGLDRHARCASGASIRVGAQLAAVEDAARLRDALGLAIPAGLPDRVHRSGAAAARRSRRPLRAHARAVRASTRWSRGSGVTAERALAALDPARGGRPRRARRVPAGRQSSASGATPACSARCAGARSPRCATRSSRSTRPRSCASSPRGTASGAAAAAPTRSSRRSSSSRASRSRCRCSSATCCPRASRATAPRCSTSSARPASWCGRAPARSAPTTAACACSSATA